MSRQKGKTRDGRNAEQAGELNLVPIMSMLVILIPVLLVAFTFVEIRFEAASAPRLAPRGDTDKAAPGVPTVLVRADGNVEVRGVEGEVYASLAPSHGSADVGELARIMDRLSDEHPAQREVRVGASAQVPWHVMARCIDASRGGNDDGHSKNVVLLAPREDAGE